MTLVTIAPGHQLDAAAAASYARMRAAGCPAGITSSYRSSAEQQHLRDLWEADPVANAYAAPPGTSDHETGQALDLWWDAAQWVRAHPDHGWRFTDPTEWWHAAYRIALDQHLAEGTRPAPLTRTQPEDPMLIVRNARSGITAVVLGDGTWALIQDAASAKSLRDAGLPSADVDPTTFDRICPGTRRRHAL